MNGARRTLPDPEIELAIRDALAAAGGRSIDPSEAAQRLASDDAWRPLLGPVRRVAAAMAERGQLEILRKGRPVAPEDLRGVVRFRLPPA